MQRDKFRLKVVTEFRFLESDYGYVISEKLFTGNVPPFNIDTERVVYESSDTRVIIVCSIRDGWGLDVLVENQAYGEFSFHTYLNLVDVDSAKMLGFSLAANDDELFELTEIYSRVLKEFGAGLLLRDDREWDRLKRAEQLGEGLSEINVRSERFCFASENPFWD